MHSGFLSSSDDEDNDTEEDEEDDEETRNKAILEKDLPACATMSFSNGKNAYCVLTFDETKTLNPVPTPEKYKELSSKLDKEVMLNPYVKYEISHKSQIMTEESKSTENTENQDDDDEEKFDWYDPESKNTYFCLTMDNT